MTFVRNPSARWHDEVPGSRWLRADLHVHTLDDSPNSNLKWPAGLSGAPGDPQVQRAYARALLKAAAVQGVEVLGLTPHATRCGSAENTSATWCIVEEWNTGNDDDGIPFRDKIYAVFPGFEANLRDGDSGLHLSFLFDPEVGRQTYLEMFALVMGGREPYNGGNLALSPQSAEDAFRMLTEKWAADNPQGLYMVIAPHAFSDRGLFTLKSEVLKTFPHEHIAALELKDGWTAEDAHRDKPFLADGLKQYRHALCHGSDAYSVDDIGKRWTLVKLARPRLDALRQAFLAADSRTRIAFKREGEELVPRGDLPDVEAGSRPWIQRVTVVGGTSIFGGSDSSGRPRTQTVHFNPDLTCVIGGRMAGKSTLLDGLRVWADRPLPADQALNGDVTARARSRFLSGGATVSAELRGPVNPTLPNGDRWPATCYSQRELQQATRSDSVRRDVLHRLVASEASGLVDRAERIGALGAAIAAKVTSAKALRQALELASQDLSQATRDRDAMDAFKSAGTDELELAQADAGRASAAVKSLGDVAALRGQTATEAKQLTVSGIEHEELQDLLENDDGARYLLRKYRAALRHAGLVETALRGVLARISQKADQRAGQTLVRVQEALVAAGGSAEDLNRFEALSRGAARYPGRLVAYLAARRRHLEGLRDLVDLVHQRDELVLEQRDAMARVAARVQTEFGGWIKVRLRADEGVEELERWIVGLRESGITRWWNSRDKTGAPLTRHRIRSRLRRAAQQDRDPLTELGMSEQVAKSFRAAMNEDRRLELYGLPSEDLYAIEMRVAETPDVYRDISELSGGTQASIMLSLVLETDDSTPLLIDQPEDELDKSFLCDRLLPALRRLKGRRQVILATHDANILVNGDADHVVFLQADHQASTVALQGTIDDPGVRETIVETVDGGRDAFELRQAKYGF